MTKYLLSAALLAALAFGGALFAQDMHMHHQPSQNGPAANSFDGQMARAMETMDKGMMVPSSGDPDRDFAAMMIPHHQGAIDMARIELQFGKNPVLRRLAQAIITDQLKEIDVMKRELQQMPAASPQPSFHR